MELAFIILSSIVIVAFIGSLGWLAQTYLWNRRLMSFQKAAGIAVTAPTKALLPSLSMVSSLALTIVGGAIAAPQLLQQPIDEANLLRPTAIQRVGSRNALNSLIQNNFYRNDFLTQGPEAGAVDAVNSSAAASSQGSSSKVVGTNEQVEGVAEGDIIKTDGDYVYYAPRYTNEVHVFEVTGPGAITQSATIDLENVYTDSLFMTDDYLIIIGYSYDSTTNRCYTDDTTEEIYCMAAMWYAPSGSVKVIDRETLESVYELKTDGYLMDYRIIEDSLFLVGNNYFMNRLDPRPTFTVTEGEETTQHQLSYDDIYYFSDTPVYGMTVLTGLKLGTFDLTSQAYLGYVNNIYVSPTALYTTQYIYNWDQVLNKSEHFVQIAKFDLDIENAAMTYRAATSVRGMPLNQFSMDEFDGNLRIATTENQWQMIETTIPVSSNSTDSSDGMTSSGTTIQQWTNVVKNRLYVLSPKMASDEFEIIGYLEEGLGKPGESIQSVRFNGDVGYVVTFLRTDPLYVLNLSDPTKPRIVGEQYETGYNTYLHPWGDDYLFGIGYSATESGQINGMKMSVYSNDAAATEPLETRQLSSYSQGSSSNWSYSYSEALWNHKALLISDDVGIVAFSVQAYEYGYRTTEGEGTWYSIYHSYYYIFTIDFTADQIISDPVIVEHEENERYYSSIDRGIYINGFVYTFSPTRVVVANFETGEILPAIALQ